LIVEDDDLLRDGLKVGLSLNGLAIDAVATAADADVALIGTTYDAIVLDLMLPDGFGLDLVKLIRSRSDSIPVLLLTARDAVADRIAGLDAGADDYLGKPFDLDEVAARLRALVRRAFGRSAPVLEWAGIVLDPARRVAEQDGREVKLSRREFAILRALMDRPRTILSKSQIEEKLYGWQEEIESNAVEVHVHHLRSKLGSSTIETVRGVGYRMGKPSC
jgi:two-component system response regulator QseB